jgi:apolipoprotein N-acyltransferase
MRLPRIVNRIRDDKSRLSVALISGVALALAYPLFELHLLAWMALTPLAWMLASGAENQPGTAPRGSFLPGFAAGFAFHLVGLYWLLAIPVTAGFKALLFVGYVLLAAYLALFFGAWSSALAWFMRAAGVAAAAQRIAVCVFASAAWVALEWGRSWMLGGFPWNFLGVSQYKMIPLIQIAQWTGVYGVSFLVCFVNIALAFTVRRFCARLSMGAKPMGPSQGGAGQGGPTRQARATPSNILSQISWELTIAMLLVMGLAMNFVRTVLKDTGAIRRPLSVALVQGNVPQDLKWEDAAGKQVWADYMRLTLEAGKDSPHLIVWPETATPPPDFALRHATPTQSRYLAAYHELKTLATRAGAPLLVGSIDIASDSEDAKERRVYNAAFLIEPSQSPDTPDEPPAAPYRKMRLVPFGEYVPLSRWLPFMKWLTPISGGFAEGTDYVIFSLKNPPTKFGVVICFEDVMADHCRQFAARGADFLLTLTNDAWFGRTAGAYQHAANSVFRAVENQRPLLRCANTGMTCVVDAHGRLVKVLKGSPEQKIFVQDILRHTLQLPEGPQPTFYTKHGDLFAWACVVLTGLAILPGAWKRRAAIQSR